LALSAAASPSDCQGAASVFESYLNNTAYAKAELQAASDIFQRVIQGRSTALSSILPCSTAISGAIGALASVPRGYQSHPTCQGLIAWKVSR
jgi:hypothetical protein